MTVPDDGALTLLDRVREFLWFWDPADIGTVRVDIPNEYDELVRSVVAMIQHGRPPAEIEGHLVDRLSKDWGVSDFPVDLEEQLRHLS